MSSLVYKSEVLEEVRPAPLHTMAPDRVIYMGTFSKSVSPSLRVNYLVLPEVLLERWREVFSEAYPEVPWITQAVLVGFSAIPEEDIVPGVQALARAWFGE